MIPLIDALDRGAHFKVADFAGIAIGLTYHLEITVVVATETLGNGSEPLALVLGTIDTGLDAFGEPEAFFLGDRGGNVGNEPAGPVGSNLIDPAVGDRDSGPSILTVFEEPLIDAAEPGEAGDLSYDDVVVVLGLDRVDEVNELLATGFSTGLTEVDELIDVLETDVVFGEPIIDGGSLVGGFLCASRGANIAGVSGHARATSLQGGLTNKGAGATDRL